jgi:hypothetical protein
VIVQPVVEFNQNFSVVLRPEMFATGVEQMDVAGKRTPSDRFAFRCFRREPLACRAKFLIDSVNVGKFCGED